MVAPYGCYLTKRKAEKRITISHPDGTLIKAYLKDYSDMINRYFGMENTIKYINELINEIDKQLDGE